MHLCLKTGVTVEVIERPKTVNEEGRTGRELG